ncbi:hypothetical protein E1A91_D09G047800v1 [Gossypium mustelinum]|uniref:Secreted protein n=1 Tax=Gossypium mustelinum TaxID=34275 RepID=A0A5D2TFK7_GOSMU|nr:hypothetical protein E1A91_D09G047800v1 [Gossypium mustelinum]
MQKSPFCYFVSFFLFLLRCWPYLQVRRTAGNVACTEAQMWHVHWERHAWQRRRRLCLLLGFSMFGGAFLG